MNSPVLPASFLGRGGYWVLGQVALMLALLAVGPLSPGKPRPMLASEAAVILVVLGAIFGVGGVMALGRNRTVFPRPRENSTLIQHGIYARVRHPLYTSVMALSLGWAAGWWSGLAGVLALGLITFLVFKARHEETLLRARFPEYAEYARRVPAFLPRIG